MRIGRIRLIGTWDTVACDEGRRYRVQRLNRGPDRKDYMETASFARGEEELPAEALGEATGGEVAGLPRKHATKPPQELVHAAGGSRAATAIGLTLEQRVRSSCREATRGA